MRSDASGYLNFFFLAHTHTHILTLICTNYFNFNTIYVQYSSHDMPNNLFSHDYGKIYKLHVTETVEDQNCVFSLCSVS